MLSPLATFVDIQTPARLTQKENLILAAFSVLYTINIAVSNISLQLVTVPVSFYLHRSGLCTDASCSSTRLFERPHRYSPSSSLLFCCARRSA